MQIIPRGGEISIEKDEGTLVMRKVRNIIRSFLKVTSKKAPPIAFIMKGVWSITEKITGLHLLPRDEDENQKSKTKQQKKQKKKKHNKSADDGEDKVAKKKDQLTKKKKQQQTSGQAQSHLSKNIKTTNPNYRIQRELKEFLKSPPPNLSVRVGKNIRIWIITMVGTKGSLYEGEKYRLRVQFPANYPTEPPSVYFLQPTPKHEHVYTNGDICLSLLGKDWRPNMTAQSIAMSILSILSGASRKSIPMDNAGHSQNKPGQKQDDWVYHDDNC